MSAVPPRVRDGFSEWARQRRNFLPNHWEHLATVWCAGCGKPVTLTMSSSVDPAATYDGTCFEKRNKEKETTK